MSVSDAADAEDTASKLRSDWHLGHDAIPSMVALLEDHDIQVIELAAHDHSDACALESDSRPFIVIRTGAPVDRLRFTLAHELAHLVLQHPSGNVPEGLADRFAGAFLVPADTAVRELGEHRDHLSKIELQLLKSKYRLSMSGWIHRAADLKIITPAENVRWQKLRNLEAWADRRASLRPDARDATAARMHGHAGICRRRNHGSPCSRVAWLESGEDSGKWFHITRRASCCRTTRRQLPPLNWTSRNPEFLNSRISGFLTFTTLGLYIGGKRD